LKENEKGVKLTYQRPKELRVVSNGNSNYGTNKEDRRSVSGHIHTVGETIVSWMSKMQQTVALLSCEAEYISQASGAQEVKFLQMLLQEIIYCEEPGILLEDNTGAISLLKNSQVSSFFIVGRPLAYSHSSNKRCTHHWAPRAMRKREGAAGSGNLLCRTQIAGRVS
jgi:hypothetical protein